MNYEHVSSLVSHGCSLRSIFVSPLVVMVPKVFLSAKSVYGFEKCFMCLQSFAISVS